MIGTAKNKLDAIEKSEGKMSSLNNSLEKSSAWYLYHTNNVQKIADQKGELKPPPPENRSLWCNTAEEISSRGNFDKKEYVTYFFDAIKNPYIGDVWLASAIEKNEVYLPCPFTGGIASCKESFYQGINYLRFVGANNEVFFIFQSITSFDLAYFPLRNVFLVGKHPPHVDIEKYSKNFEKNIEKLINIWENSRTPKFAGIIISHFFPFHFYSEAVPALERASHNNLLEKVPAVYARKGGCFFELHHVWPEINNEFHLTGPEMDTIPNSNGNFSIMLGTAMDYKDPSQAKHMRIAYAKIANVYASKFSTRALHINFSTLRNSSTPIIWIGVQATKRSWIEQVEGISEIIISTLKKYPKAGFVFDGWTSPLYERKADIEPIQLDRNILQEIFKITGPINHVSLVGAMSIDKIAIAQSIDAFITNYGTGSLHVARIARKYGIGHINTTFPKDMHVHYNTICLSEGVVEDIRSDDSTRADAISYSLDWKVIDHHLQEILQKQFGKY